MNRLLCRIFGHKTIKSLRQVEPDGPFRLVWFCLRCRDTKEAK